MRQIVVFVSDYKAERRLSITFSAEDFSKVEKYWNVEDSRLLNLQSIPAFKGYTKWGHCKTEHFRILIARLMEMMDEVGSEALDADNPVMESFNFFILCLINHIEIRTDTRIDVMKVTRITRQDILFEFDSTMDMSFAQPEPNEIIDDPEDVEPATKPTNPFRIVVDNTKAK